MAFENVLNNPLFNIGAGILAENYGGRPTGSVIGKGIFSGLSGLQERRESQTMLEQARRNMAEKERQRKAQEALLAQQRAYLEAQAQPGMVSMGPPTPSGIMEQQPGQQNDQQRLYEAAATVPGGVSMADIMAIENLPYARAKATQQQQQKFSMSPTFFKDPMTGEVKLGQAASSGGFHFPKLPGGVVPVVPESTISLGDRTIVRPRGGGTEEVYVAGLKPGEQPIVRREQSYQSAAGKTAGTTAQQAKEMLYGAELDAGRTVTQINDLRNHPGLASATGFSSWMPAVRGTDRADFEARMNQVTGGAFLQAYSMLKGGGQITEVEGLKAEQAVARMQNAQSKEDFLVALDDYENAVQDGLKKIQDKAGVKPVGYISEREMPNPDAPIARQPESNTRRARREVRDRNRALESKYGL